MDGWQAEQANKQSEEKMSTNINRLGLHAQQSRLRQPVSLNNAEQLKVEVEARRRISTHTQRMLQSSSGGVGSFAEASRIDVPGVTAAEAADAAEVPTPLVAVTRNE